MKKSQVSWTLKELRILQDLVKAGMSGAKIHRSHFLPKHSESGICARMSLLGIGNSLNKKRTLQAKRINREKRAKIILFLKTDGRNMPSYDAAKVLGISQEMVMYYRRQCQLTTPQEVSFSSEHYKETRKKSYRNRDRKLREYRESFWMNRREQLIKQLIKDVEKNCISTYLKCNCCGERWPRNSNYFNVSNRKGKIILIQRCRACRNDWRDKQKARQENS